MRGLGGACGRFRLRGSPHRCVSLLPARSLPNSGGTDFAVLGLTPFASRHDVKHAYKRLALKYHPDVIRGENGQEKEETFREVKSAYESLMLKFEEETAQAMDFHDDEWEEWDEWMGLEGGLPIAYNPS